MICLYIHTCNVILLAGLITLTVDEDVGAVEVVEQGGGGEAGVGLRIDECGTRVLFEAGGGGSRGIPAFFVVFFCDEAGVGIVSVVTKY